MRHLLVLLAMLAACNQVLDEDMDADGDGFTADVDCDDTDADVNPDAEEICDEGVDNDCDGQGCRLPAQGIVKADADLVHALPEEVNTFLYAEAVGDVDGDGTDDLLYARHPSDLSLGSAFLFLDLEEGSLPEVADLVFEPAACGWWRTCVGAGDVNGDGVDDLLLGESDDWLGPYGSALHLGGEGLGVHGSAWRLTSANEDTAKVPSARGLGDFDGDGLDDMVFGLSSSTHEEVVLFFGHTDISGLVTPEQADIRWTDDDSSSTTISTAMTSGDTDADGLADLGIIDANGGGVYLFRGHGGAGEHAIDEGDTLVHAIQRSPWADTAMNGDLDGDGYDDLLLNAWADLYANAEVAILHGPLQPEEQASEVPDRVQLDPDMIPFRVVLVPDADGDGRDELAFVAMDSDYEAGAAFLLYGPVRGLVESSNADTILSVEQESSSSTRSPESLAAADLNGDGFGDLVVTTADTTARIENFGYVFLSPGF